MFKSANKCTSCTAGRQQIRDAYRKNGIIGVVKETPNIIRTISGKEPNIRNNKWRK